MTIAKDSKGRAFAPLARYLVRRSSGTETNRVAWRDSRNLGLDDPELAAPLMQATAARSDYVRKPVYHLTLSFHPADQVVPDQMRMVADRVLADLGLLDHQAVLVAHRDRPHPHVHLMLNRVHPDTGIAWKFWGDHWRIEETLHQVDQALGLHEPRRWLQNGVAELQRQGAEPGLVQRARAHVSEMRKASS